MEKRIQELVARSKDVDLNEAERREIAEELKRIFERIRSDGHGD
ncbi:MAG TPA: hypothetical protein VJL09_02385 [Candidatus Paceibacterota bacterium]